MTSMLPVDVIIHKELECGRHLLMPIIVEGWRPLPQLYSSWASVPRAQENSVTTDN